MGAWARHDVAAAAAAAAVLPVDVEVGDEVGRLAAAGVGGSCQIGGVVVGIAAVQVLADALVRRHAAAVVVDEGGIAAAAQQGVLHVFPATERRLVQIPPWEARLSREKIRASLQK